MAAATALPVRGSSRLASTSAPEEITSVKLRLSFRRLGVGRKEVSPDAAFLEDPSEDDSHDSASPRISPPSWISSPGSHPSNLPTTQYADLDDVIPVSLSRLRQRSTRVDAERRSRQWLSGTLALLGGMMAMVFAAYQMRFSLPALKKGAESGSSRSYASASSSPSGTGAPPPGIAGSIQEAVASKPAALRRQWMFGVFAIALSIFSAKFLARLHALTLGVRRWLKPKRVKQRLPLHSKVEEEFAELYSIKDESVGTKDFDWGSDPLVITAIRKCLDDYRALSRQTHQSAFAIFFHLAAQSRRRQIAYSMYRNACDALHAKVEQNMPVLSEEVAEVLNRQRALRLQYSNMKDDISFVLSEDNLPAGLCQDELEFLTRDFRPALLELANHTIYSLDMDRRFIEAFTKLHHIEYVWQEDRIAPDNSNPNDMSEQTDLQEPLRHPEDHKVIEEKKSHREESDSESESEMAMHESQFWDARRTLSSYRRGTFMPKVPDFDRCFLPELPLSLFAY
ncbi:hypothetical protein, conserved [Eimeria brunetti]|uniref:Uncharacterized protein n=1 Tax=Eimeria brunetti TaxID=51314 RepID=U6LFK4_9EIME|nr:hypothetical protein, conserved [Eimeria brunetti]